MMPQGVGGYLFDQIWNMGPSPHGSLPTYMGRGPDEPLPMWAIAHMGESRCGSEKCTSHPNAIKLCIVNDFMKTRRCGTSRIRSVWRWYRAEMSALHQKTKDFIFAKRARSDSQMKSNICTPMPRTEWLTNGTGSECIQLAIPRISSQ